MEKLNKFQICCYSLCAIMQAASIVFNLVHGNTRGLVLNLVFFIIVGVVFGINKGARRQVINTWSSLRGNRVE